MADKHQAQTIIATPKADKASRAAHREASDAHTNAIKAIKTAMDSPTAENLKEASSASWYAHNLSDPMVIAGLAEKPVKKGDVPGHPFHGNQFVDAAAMAERAVAVRTSGGNPTSIHDDLAGHHSDKTQEMFDKSEAAEAAGDWEKADAYAAAARLHDVASMEHDSASMAVTDGTIEAQKVADGLAERAVFLTANDGMSSAFDLAEQHEMLASEHRDAANSAREVLGDLDLAYLHDNAARAHGDAAATLRNGTDEDYEDYAYEAQSAADASQAAAEEAHLYEPQSESALQATTAALDAERRANEL